MRRDAYLAVVGCLSCPLEWCCPCGLLLSLSFLILRCVCVGGGVFGDACRVGRSVVAGFGGEIRSRCSFQCQEIR